MPDDIHQSPSPTLWPRAAARARSYGPRINEVAPQVGVYVGRILKAENQPTAIIIN
jgi:hypothetical protein